MIKQSRLLSSLVLSTVHWSVLPAFLSERARLWRISSGGKTNPDTKTNRRVPLWLYRCDRPLSQTRLSSGPSFILKYSLSAFLLLKHKSQRAWWSRAIDPAVIHTLTAKGARSGFLSKSSTPSIKPPPLASTTDFNTAECSTSVIWRSGVSAYLSQSLKFIVRANNYGMEAQGTTKVPLSRVIHLLCHIYANSWHRKRRTVISLKKNKKTKKKHQVSGSRPIPSFPLPPLRPRCASKQTRFILLVSVCGPSTH